jgi:tRNA(Ile)-lysidine synthase
VEEAAREARYRFLFEKAGEFETQAVAVGHTADDQVETVLMHLLRGAGLSGLSGMPARALPNAWSETIPLVRPLLGYWREQTEEYCRAQSLEPLIDPTNVDPTYYRNRLRRELIPYLESYNHSVKQVLWRTADILRGDLEIVTQAVEAAWSESLVRSGLGYVALSKSALLEQNKGLQRQVIRQAIAALRPGLRDVDYAAVERTLETLNDPTPRTGIDLIAGLKLITEEGLLWVADWNAELPREDWPQSPPGKTVLHVPGEVALPAGWRLVIREEADPHPARQAAYANPDPFQAWIALDGFAGQLCLRARQAGDLFKPLGLGGHSMKLAEFMINQKIPRLLRDSWPLVCAGEEIVWIPGLRSAHSFQVEDRTQRILHLQLKGPDLLENER